MARDVDALVRSVENEKVEELEREKVGSRCSWRTCSDRAVLTSVCTARLETHLRE